MEYIQVESKDGIAMYYKQHVEPLLKRLTINEGASTSSGDDDASYGSDEDEKRLRIVETYPPKKN